jgi:ABC-type multidrug transport system fused ATPase/permease subunit
VGGLTGRLASDCRAISSCISTNLNVALRYGFQALGGGLYLALASPRLAAVCAAVAALLLAASSVYGGFQRRSQRLATDLLSESSQAASEALSLHRCGRPGGGGHYL